MMNKQRLYIIKIFLDMFYFACVFIFINSLLIQLIFICILIASYFILYFIDKAHLKDINGLINHVFNMINNDHIHSEISYGYEETVESKLLYQIIEYQKKQKLAQEELDKTKNSLQSLITHISHQVKTPIANMKLYQSLLQRNDLSEEEKRMFLTMMAQQIEKLNFLMESLVKMSRLENDMIKLNIKSNKINDTVMKALNDALFLVEQKNIKVIFKKSRDIYALYDEKWTQEAIYNVLDNCAKYSNENTTITISVTENTFFGKIMITDQGKGIKKENYNKIFQRFYRETEVHDKEGIGIGLFLTREILTKEEGYITVQSVLRKGSTFTIYLKK